jgi:hypothetical protein
MQTTDAARSDIDLVGLTLRCSDVGFHALMVFLKPFPPRTHPRVRLTSGGATVHLEARVIPPGAAISLPAEAATLGEGIMAIVFGTRIEVDDNNTVTRGVISLVGLGPATSHVELPITI